MTLQSSGAISLNNVNVELGRSGTTAINMNETVVRTLAGKASGAISMSDFYGKSNETVSLSNLTVSSSGQFSSQSARYTLESDGDVITETTTFGIADAGDWISPKAAAPSDYQVRATLISGDTPGVGTFDTWLVLTSNRTWTLQQFAEGGAKEAVITIEIRKGTGATLTSADITLYAERFPDSG
jgi:hypothetical protein